MCGLLNFLKYHILEKHIKTDNFKVVQNALLPKGTGWQEMALAKVGCFSGCWFDDSPCHSSNCWFSWFPLLLIYTPMYITDRDTWNWKIRSSGKKRSHPDYFWAKFVPITPYCLIDKIKYKVKQDEIKLCNPLKLEKELNIFQNCILPFMFSF